MAPTYYQIELSARVLTTLLLVLALVLVLAFAFGYGAAWSVLSAGSAPSPTPLPTATEIAATSTPEVVASAPPVEPSERPTGTRPPRPTAAPRPTAVRPAPTAQPTVAGETEYWVQVLAVERRQAVDDARSELDELGFPAGNQRVLPTRVAGGTTLYKVRVGPFPDRLSADRVVQRMQGSGFPDAWVVTP